MIMKIIIICFVIVSIFKDSESRSARKHEIKIKEKSKTSIEEPQSPLSNKKHENEDVDKSSKDASAINKEKDLKPTKGRKTLKGQNNNKTKPHTQTELKKNVEDLKYGKAKILDHSTASRLPLPLATMDEVLHNKTAQLIRIIQNTEISSDENDPSNINNHPPDEPKHERRFVIRNFDVLESYIKSRRFKKDQSLEWSRESSSAQVSQPNKFDNGNKKPALKVINYDEFSDDYIMTTTKGKILVDDDQPWEELETQTVNWDDVETSGQRDRDDDENENLEAKGLVDDHDTNESKKGLDHIVQHIKKVVGNLNKSHNKNNKPRKRKAHKSVHRNKSKKEHVSKLQHNAPNFELLKVRKQRHREPEPKKSRLIKSFKTKERKKHAKKKHKKRKAIHGIENVIAKRVNSNTKRISTDQNANSFIKRTLDTSNNMSNKRNQFARSFNDYNDNNTTNPYVYKNMKTANIYLNVSSKAKSIKEIEVIDDLSSEIPKLLKNNNTSENTEEKENAANDHAVQRTEDIYNDPNNRQREIGVENSVEDRIRQIEKVEPDNDYPDDMEQNDQNKKIEAYKKDAYDVERNYENEKVEPYKNYPDNVDSTQSENRKAGSPHTERDDETLSDRRSVEVTISFYEDKKDMKKDDYENDFQSNKKDNKKDNYRDDYHSNKEVTKGALRAPQDDDYNDDYRNNKKDDYKENYRSNEKQSYSNKNDWGDNKEKNTKNKDWGDNKEKNTKNKDWGDNREKISKNNDWGDNREKISKNKDWGDSREKISKNKDWGDSREKISKNKDWGDSREKISKNNDWEDNREKQSNKGGKKESHNNDQENAKTWDRHANNDWGNVGVGDVRSSKKATTRRTTKRRYDYKEPQRSHKNDYRDEIKPERSYNKGYRDEERPGRSHNKGYRDEVRPERSYNKDFNKGNREEVKPEKSDKRWDRHENNNWDEVGVYEHKKGSRNQSMRDNDRPTYVHTPFPHRGR